MIARQKPYFIGLAITYMMAFVSVPLVSPLAILMILWSYIILFKTRSIVPVIALIIYARSIVGFISYGNQSLYTLLSLIVNYIPSIIYIILNINNRHKNYIHEMYKFSFLYAIVLIIFCFVGGESSLALFGDRLAPFFLFIFIVGRDSDTNANLEYSYRYMMRVTIPAAIIIVLLPDYASVGESLLRDGTIFGTESITSLSLGLLPRATGPLWDPRILGILCFLNLYISLSTQTSKFRNMDIALSLIGVGISLSRGSIIAAGILLSFFLLSRRSATGVITMMFGLVCLIFSWQFILTPMFERIFLVGGVNPLEQRSSFFIYAFNRFLDQPLGIGIGKLRSISDAVIVVNAQYDAITDAYIAILLAEIGIIGFFVFILSFTEIFWGSNKLSPAVLGAFLIQMVGTDIPDFGPHYLVILLVGAMGASMGNPLRTSLFRQISRFPAQTPTGTP